MLVWDEDADAHTFHLHSVDLRHGRQVFLEVFDGVRDPRLLHVGECCAQLCWGAVCLGRLFRVSG